MFLYYENNFVLSFLGKHSRYERDFFVALNYHDKPNRS